MNPHRLQPLSATRFPLAGFRQHRRYVNDGPVKSYLAMPSVQSESDVLAAVRNEFGIDHYNPRRVPVLASADIVLALSWVRPAQNYAWDGIDGERRIAKLLSAWDLLPVMGWS